MLTQQMRKVLAEQAGRAEPITYKGLADRLGLTPPQTIHRVTQALEELMAQDAEAGRPLLAALCVGRLGQGLPARGFFAAASALGLFSGDPQGAEAQAFHARELQRAISFYGAPT